jgi:hypothetical protein
VRPLLFIFVQSAWVFLLIFLDIEVILRSKLCCFRALKRCWMRRLRGNDFSTKGELFSSIAFWHWGSFCGRLFVSVLLTIAFEERRVSLTPRLLRLLIRGKLFRAGELSRNRSSKVCVRLLSLLGGLVPVLCERLKVRGFL